jgi:competence protein ComFC
VDAAPEVQWNARVHPRIERAGGWLLDQLYPTRCAGCGRFGPVLCQPCGESIEPGFGVGRCPNCSARWTAALNCPRCQGWKSLDRAVAAVEMDGAARKLVHGLKYRRERVLAPAMAHRMAGLPVEMECEFDCAMAVPLHRSRQRSRGFNQAEVLLTLLPWPRTEGRLVRMKNTVTQVGRHERERRANVAGAFRYAGPGLAGVRVALVDDVVTTGATMDECATVLKDAGARSVVAIAFARASFEGVQAPQD